MSQFNFEPIAVIWAAAMTGVCIEIVGLDPMAATAATFGFYVVMRGVEAVGRLAWDLAKIRRGSA